MLDKESCGLLCTEWDGELRFCKDRRPWWKRFLNIGIEPEWFYVEFHADSGHGCTAGRRRFSAPEPCNALYDLLKADRGHRCPSDSVTCYKVRYKQSELGYLWASDHRYSAEMRQQLLAITTNGPESAPRPTKYPKPPRGRMPVSIWRLQRVLDQVAIRVGSIGIGKEHFFFYQIITEVPAGAAWPKAQGKGMLLFQPLCWLNNWIVRKR